jgi:hypothetical protein
VDVWIHIYLTSALVGGEWSASRLGRFTPGKSLRYQLDKRLGGPRNQSGRHGEENNLAPTGTRTPTPRSSSPKPVAIPTKLSRLPLFIYLFVFKVQRNDPSIFRLLVGASYQPRMLDNRHTCIAIYGVRTGRGKRSTRSNPPHNRSHMK